MSNQIFFHFSELTTKDHFLSFSLLHARNIWHLHKKIVRRDCGVTPEVRNFISNDISDRAKLIAVDIYNVNNCDVVFGCTLQCFYLVMRPILGRYE